MAPHFNVGVAPTLGFTTTVQRPPAGVRLDINGLGSHWSGGYAVTETAHSFDVQHGYRVAFACSR